jgi:Icc-related predicted phosphoesterase
MRCLLVSDLHYALKQYDWVNEVADRYDVVVIAGDHLDLSGHVDAQVQMTVMLKYFRDIGARTKLLVCSGNHDLDARNAAGEKTSRWIMKARHLGVPTDGEAFEFDGALFTICPWWDGPGTRDEVSAQLRRDAERRSGPWIWVYHAPPAASPTSWSGTKHFGDADLNQWIAEHKPDIVLTGHIHDAPFRSDGSWVDRLESTWVFNAGRQLGPVPTYVVFDQAAGEALWSSTEGMQSVRLDAPLTRPIPNLSALPDWLK